jgi:tRNA(Ile)-lysidine synthase
VRRANLTAVTTADDPIRADELDALFALLGEERAEERLALAVSGGSDSTALMVLVADWLHRHGRDPAAHIVLTVDHGLRPESGAEAAAVADRADALGFRHATLVWEGPKPQTGIQAAARDARYRLMRDHTRAHGIATLLTAHTLDDQAETLLMRLARGSGLDGLAAIAPSTHFGPLRIVRPLLGVAKSRLIATLRARAIPWIEDPSNRAPAFERTRLRAARGELDALGLTSEMLASSARRLQRARAALDGVTDTYCAEPPQGVVHTDPCGVFRIDRARLMAAPEEIVLRLLERCIGAAGGSGEPVPLAKLEAVVAGLRRRDAPAAGSWTLGRALIAAGDAIEIEREPGRHALPRLTLAGTAGALWDGRFAIHVAGGGEESVEVRALGPDGVAELRRLGRALKATRAAQLCPSFWRGTRLLAVPPADIWVGEEAKARYSAAFVGLRYNLGDSGSLQSGEFDTIA